MTIEKQKKKKRTRTRRGRRKSDNFVLTARIILDWRRLTLIPFLPKKCIKPISKTLVSSILER